MTGQLRDSTFWQGTRSVGEIAQAAGITTSAVRFYEREGIVASVRTSGNQRRFTPGAACRIQVARVAQRVGLTVREIAAILAELPTDPEPEDWQHVTDLLVAEAESRITRLRRTLDDLGSPIALCLIDVPIDPDEEHRRRPTP